MIVILDNGHGESTPGKRSPEGMLCNPGQTALFEYEFNRNIVCRLKPLLEASGIEYYELVPEVQDIALSVRARKANQFYANNPDSFLVSIHANAFKPNTGTGWEAFAWQNPSNAYINKNSAILADTFYQAAADHFGDEFRIRTGAPQLFKTANFKIQRETQMPSVLTENFFMDHEKDLAFIISDEGRQRIAQMHHDAIKQYIQKRALIDLT